MSEGSFECKVSGKRESANGIFLTLQIQPDDYKEALATLRVGSSLMMGWSEVVNTTVEEIGFTASEIAKIANHGTKLSPEVVDAKMPKDRKPFASLPLSQQAGIRCQDEEYKAFLVWRCPSTPGLKWSERVHILCRVNSRAGLVRGTEAGDRWLALEDEYQAYLTDQRYASVAR